MIKTRAYLEGHDSDEKYNRGPGTHISFKYRKYGSQPLGMNDAIESTTKLCITCIIFIYYTKKEKKNKEKEKIYMKASVTCFTDNTVQGSCHHESRSRLL